MVGLLVRLFVVGCGQPNKAKIHVEFLSACVQALREFVGALFAGVHLFLEVYKSEVVPFKLVWESCDLCRECVQLALAWQSNKLKEPKF